MRALFRFLVLNAAVATGVVHCFCFGVEVGGRDEMKNGMGGPDPRLEAFASFNSLDLHRK